MSNIFKSKLFLFIIIIFFIIYFATLLKKMNIESYRMFNLQNIYSTITLEENNYKYNLLGNGFYTYKVKEEPEVVAHSFTNTRKNIFLFDLDDRVVKHYYDKWIDDYKENFIVNEKYEDCRYLWHNEKSWIYSFEAYVNVSNYDEMMQATEAIIRFDNFMKHFDICEKFYIYYNNQKIYPHNASNGSDDYIRQSAITQFNKIENEEK